MKKTMFDRREFLSGMMAAGATTALPAPSVPLKWRLGELQVHFVYTGLSEAIFVILPDSTSVLLDCGDNSGPKSGRWSIPVPQGLSITAGEAVAKYVADVNPNGTAVDYMVLTHFHCDHCGRKSDEISPRPDGAYFRSGFGSALESLSFRKAIDRGWPDYASPHPLVEQRAELEHMKKIYAYLAKRDGLTVERLRVGARDQLVPLHGGVGCEAFTVFNLAASGVVADEKSGRIRDWYAKFPGGRIDENPMSIAFIMSLGKFRLYTGGDLYGFVWDEKGERRWLETVALPPAIAARVHVAKTNHHASDSMNAETCRALSPQVWVSQVWNPLQNKDAALNEMAKIDGCAFYPGWLDAKRLDAPESTGWRRMVERAAIVGSHTVVTVAPGGDRYSVAAVSPVDGSMLSVRSFTC